MTRKWTRKYLVHGNVGVKRDPGLKRNYTAARERAQRHREKKGAKHALRYERLVLSICRQLTYGHLDMRSDLISLNNVGNLWLKE